MLYLLRTKISNKRYKRLFKKQKQNTKVEIFAKFKNKTLFNIKKG